MACLHIAVSGLSLPVVMNSVVVPTYYVWYRVGRVILQVACSRYCALPTMVPIQPFKRMAASLLTKCTLHAGHELGAQILLLLCINQSANQSTNQPFAAGISESLL